ncbi:hypothetical protein [Solirubrobacter phytolaccae]|uniref:hypothetical protein n=1 Tax=Solirubrobacter phytolaccae TaxID=1404360 RepID=UPI0022CDCCCE|nr:hypothetical protein [Solirubrobacter phytolaccae]
MSAPSSHAGTSDPPIGAELIFCGETYTFQGRDESGKPILFRKPTGPTRTEAERDDWEFDEGTSAVEKARAIRSGAARMAAHARRMPAGSARNWTLATARRGLRQAHEIKRREIDANTSVARAPRAQARERRPRRRSSSSSTTSSADPGEPPAEPHDTVRRCAAAWCDHPVYGSGQKRYCGTLHCDRARAEERQRKSRADALDLVEHERRHALERARRAGMVGPTAFAGPGEHSLSFLWKHQLIEGEDPGEFEALRFRRTRLTVAA